MINHKCQTHVTVDTDILNLNIKKVKCFMHFSICYVLTCCFAAFTILHLLQCCSWWLRHFCSSSWKLWYLCTAAVLHIKYLTFTVIYKITDVTDLNQSCHFPCVSSVHLSMKMKFGCQLWVRDLHTAQVANN